MISKYFNNSKHQWNENKRYLYFDLGNGKDSGQIIIGQKDSRYGDFFEHFPDVQDEKVKESCSMPEALSKQDLNINRLMALHASNLLWKLFRKGKLECCGMYINGNTNQIAEIAS